MLWIRNENVSTLRKTFSGYNMLSVGVHYDAVKAILGQFLVLAKLSSFRLPDVASVSALWAETDEDLGWRNIVSNKY